MLVFDSSALLALIFDEAGATKVEALLAGDDNVVGAANLLEVLAKLVDQGMSDAEVEAVLEGLAIRVEPLSQAQALAAGRLRRQTRALGLSLGDRCCLALAETLDATDLTTDRAWAGVPGPIAVDACPLNADARSGRRSGTARWRHDRRVPDAERQTGAVSGFNGTWCRAVSVWTMILAQ